MCGGLTPAGSSLARSILPHWPRCSPEPELSSLLVPNLISQNHRVIEVERELCLTPLLKQGHGDLVD